MLELATAISLGIALFIATNVDDIVLLLAFLAEPGTRVRDVVIGQYLGTGALVGISLVAALITLVIPPTYVGLLGLVPIALGIKALVDLLRDRDEDDEAADTAQFGTRSRMLAVAAVTIANGGDNIGVYTPAFAVQSGFRTAVVICVFAVMTAVWCAFANWLVNHPTLGSPIRRYGQRLLPFILIGLGVAILLEAGTLRRL